MPGEHSTQHATDAPASREQIIAITGHIGDDKIARVIATGATPAQVLEAHTRLIRQDEVGAETERALHGAVLDVYEILRAGEPEWDESHDSD